MLPQANNNQSKDDMAALRRECGLWLKERREAAGLSQREIANLVGIEYYTFISQIESGRGRVPPERFEAYASAIKVAPREFAMTMLRYNEPHVYRLITGDVASPAPEKEPVSLATLAERLQRLEDCLSLR